MEVPEDEVEQARTAAETAAIVLFVAAATDVSASDTERVRLISFELAERVALLALRSVAAPAGVEWFPEPEARRIAEAVRDRPEVQSALVDQLRRIRQSNDSAPARDPGELSLAREGARHFATFAYARVLEDVAHLLPTPPWLANVLLRKTWISQGDNRVRPLHRRLHGRTRKFDEDFWRWPQTGQTLRFPGDPDAPLDATLGCRCLCWLSWAPGATVRPLGD